MGSSEPISQEETSEEKAKNKFTLNCRYICIKTNKENATENYR